MSKRHWNKRMKEIIDTIHTWHLELLGKYKQKSGGEVIHNFKVATNDDVSELITRIERIAELTGKDSRGKK